MVTDKPGYEHLIQFLTEHLALFEQQGTPTSHRKTLGVIIEEQIAEQIIQKAKDSGVFVHESRELVSLLMNVDLDQQIPPGLYQAIAELLAWVYQIENKEFNIEG